MATIYQKTLIDKTLILDPREYLLRQFDLGADWTEVRFGFFFTLVTAADDNTNAVAETVNINTPADWPVFGLKDSASTILPGLAGSYFLGAFGFDTGAAGTTLFGAPPDHLGSAGLGHYSVGGYYGNLLKAPLTDINLFPETWSWQLANPANGYNGFMGLKFVIANRGLVGQTVAMTQSLGTAVPGTDYSTDNLRTYLNNTTYQNNSGVGPVPWNDGVAAYPIPDAVFIRLPYFNNRIRLSAMEIIRYV